MTNLIGEYFRMIFSCKTIKFGYEMVLL